MSYPTASAWMDTDPVTLFEDAQMGEALRVLGRRRARHACVVRDGILVGVITQADLHRALPSPLAGDTSEDYARVLEGVTLATVMTHDPVTAGPGMDLAEAAATMLDLGVHCLPVVDRGRLVGLLTERDCLRALIDQLRFIAGGAAPPAQRPGGLMVRLLLIASSAFLGACATPRAPGTSAEDMSAAEHGKHAQKHADLADEHASTSALDLATASSIGTEPLPPGARIWRAGMLGGVHRSQASRHEEHARQHAAAATALEGAEESACQAAPTASRESCPLEAAIVAIDSVEGGVRLHVREGGSLEDAVAGLRCHVARAATLGHEGMPACPLYARGLTVHPVPEQGAVDILAATPAGAAALQRAILDSLP